jgi:hypothetical protein
MPKLYCYVDENGMETEGRIFIIAVVVVAGDPLPVFTQCEEFERISDKGKFKWRKAERLKRLDYLRRAFRSPALHGRSCYVVFRGTNDYEAATVEGIARVLRYFEAAQGYKTFVYIDALSKSKRREYGALLRKSGVSTYKVQGVTKEENNALVRLADAIAGFVRDALDGDSDEIVALFEEAKSASTLIEV